MAIQDGLAISQGTNRGEAAFLGESSFDPIEYSYQWAQRKRRENEENKLSKAQDVALLNDRIKTQWDSDTFNYFNPKVEQLKSSIMDAMKTSKGQLTPIQKMEFKGAWDEIKGEAEVNNQLWKSYQDQVKNLEADPQGEKWDRDVSIKKLQMFRDPYSVPELKAEIQQNYGGNINAWRTANYAKYGLEPSYNFDKYIGDITKDEKVQDYVVKDPKTGKPIEGKYSTGEKYITVGQKYTPEQVSSITNRIWNENNYKSDKTKERAISFVDKTYSLGDGGIVTFPSEMPPEEKKIAQKAIQYAGDMRGLSVAEMQKKLAKGYLSAVIDIRGDQGTKPHDLGFAPQGNNYGGGKGFSDKWTTSVAPAQSVATDVRAFNKRYGTNYTAEEFGSNKINPKTIGYIAIEPKSKGGDTESIQLNINGKQVRPIGYKLQDGKIFMTISEVVPSEDALGKVVYKNEISAGVPANPEAAANIAAHYGFETVDEFKKMLQEKQKSLGLSSENIPVSKPKQKEIKQAEIAAKAVAAGYTVPEYTELLKKNGIKIIQ